jgi:hypothetical protein
MVSEEWVRSVSQKIDRRGILDVKDLDGKNTEWKPKKLPISFAVESKDLDTVRLLLDKGVSVSSACRKELRVRYGRLAMRRTFRSMMWLAVKSGTYEIVEALLNYHDFTSQLESLNVSASYCPFHESGRYLWDDLNLLTIAVQKATTELLELLLSKISPAKRDEILCTLAGKTVTRTLAKIPLSHLSSITPTHYDN